MTLTVNPAVDVSASVEKIVPFSKLRCADIRRDPGGGGINVARVVTRLGGEAMAVYPAGGASGQLLRGLLQDEGIPNLAIPAAQETRQDFTVFEEVTEQQYRFILPGPVLSEQEWRACLDAIAAVDKAPRYIVASGSLPPGAPHDFYGRVSRVAHRLGAKTIVDASGPALRAALDEGVCLIKPNLREFRELVGERLADEDAWIKAGRALIDRGAVQFIALTLGHQGALLISRDRALRAQALPIKPISVVGAGDSFTGALVWRPASGHAVDDALRCGMAAGSAALLHAGTELCRLHDIERLVSDVVIRTV